MSDRLRVGMYASVGPRCGIADYTRELVNALAVHADITTIPLCAANLNPLRPVLAGLRLSCQDVAHIQHTYSFWGIDQLTHTLLIRILFTCIRTPMVLTAHTVRDQGPARFAGGLGSRLANAVGAPAWIDCETFRRADAIIVHADFHKQRLVARGLPPGRIHVIPPGIPSRVPVQAGEVEAFRARVGIPSGSQTVGVLGFLEGSKRFSDLMEAVVSLPNRPFLLLAGGPRLPAHETIQMDLAAAAARYGVSDRLVVTGYLEPAAVPIALEAMDVVVVPYATDSSMSYSLHRALGQGRPVVATDLPTMREVQARGSCLALVPSADPAALRETLARLLADVPARARLAAAAHTYAVRESMATAAARTLRVYDSVRDGHR